VTQGLNLKEAI
jgi:hypothetical protein